MDVAGILITFQIAAIFFAFPMALGKVSGGLAFVCGLAFIFLWSTTRYPIRYKRLLAGTPFPEMVRERLLLLMDRFSEGSAILRQARYVLAAFVFSLCLWICEATLLYCVIRAFQLPLPYASAYFLLLFLTLSVALPQAPGYVGTIEFFGVLALGLLGIPKAQALPIILSVHGLQFLCISTFGLTALSMEGISLSRFLNREVEMATPVDGKH
jgi:uncharacterized protein (TIRG00374 family)